MNVASVVHVNTSAPYDVIVGHDILKDCAEAIARVAPCPRTLALVCDDVVEPLYTGTVSRSLEDAGYRVIRFTFANGEQSKSMETLIELLNFLAENKVTRTDYIVALGGGVTGDLAGLAAAIYLRGIHFIQMPTTLLAAVDSSVGGKTAVNLDAGKNLCGAFHQPDLVICDCDTFDSLCEEHFVCGLAEAIKYGILCDRELFQMFEAYRRGDSIADIIARCVQIKADYVVGDEEDHGKRQFLNLGHTPAHSIEKLSHFGVLHGHAVAAGMAIMARACEKKGICKEAFSQRLCKLLEKHNLPTASAFDARAMAEVALSDKKRRGGKITLVVMEEIGKCALQEIPVEELEDFFRAGELV